jgi:hypothetical protein
MGVDPPDPPEDPPEEEPPEDEPPDEEPPLDELLTPAGAPGTPPAAAVVPPESAAVELELPSATVVLAAGAPEPPPPQALHRRVTVKPSASIVQVDRRVLPCIILSSLATPQILIFFACWFGVSGAEC